MMQGVKGSSPWKICPTCFLAHQKRKVKRCSRDCANKLLSLKSKGIPKSDEHSLKIAKSLKGMKFSDERKKNISSGRKGKTAREKHHFWIENREEYSIVLKNRKILRQILRHTLDCLKANKSSKTVDILGYDENSLREHLEYLFQPGMDWNNYGFGRGKWCVDHVRPISSWPSGSSPSVVNALENLRPLWFVENCSKGAKYNV